MPFARASELDRLLACPGSLVLPRTAEKSERAVIAANWGTATHHWVETGQFPEGRVGTSLKKKVQESGVTRDQYWKHGLHEVPLAYNVQTRVARALVLPVSPEEKQAWKDAWGDEWIVGTADYVGLLLDAPWVDDLKTGREAEWLSHRYQQTFYCMAWGLFHTGELSSSRSTITHWPRYPLKASPRRYGVVLEVDELLEFQNKLADLRTRVLRLRELQEGATDVVPRLNDGPQCVYCPSKPSCIKGQKYE